MSKWVTIVTIFTHLTAGPCLSSGAVGADHLSRPRNLSTAGVVRARARLTVARSANQSVAIVTIQAQLTGQARGEIRAVTHTSLWVACSMMVTVTGNTCREWSSARLLSGEPWGTLLTELPHEANRTGAELHPWGRRTVFTSGNGS